MREIERERGGGERDTQRETETERREQGEREKQRRVFYEREQ